MITTCQEYRPSCEEEYMNSRQLDYFRRILTQWRNHLQQEGRKSLQRIRTNEQHGGDMIDQSVKDHGRIMDFITRDRIERTIRQIAAALRRIDEGSYGYCLASGEEIGIQRLVAYPIATLSVEAQERLENRQRTMNVVRPC